VPVCVWLDVPVCVWLDVPVTVTEELPVPLALNEGVMVMLFVADELDVPVEEAVPWGGHSCRTAGPATSQEVTEPAGAELRSTPECAMREGT